MAARMRPRLRVVLLLRSPLAPAWAADLACALLATDDFDVAALVVPHGSRARPNSASGSTWLSGRIVAVCRSVGFEWKGPARGPFALVDLRRVTPALRVDPLSLGCPGAPETPIDVAVATDSSLAIEDYADRGVHFRLGAWYSPQLDCPARRAEFRGPSEAAGLHGLRQLAVTVSSVGGIPRCERQVMAADVPLESPLITRNRAQAAWGAASLLLAALEHACRDDWTAPAERPAKSPAWAARPDEDPPSGSSAPLAGRPKLSSYAGRVAASAVKRVALKRQWLLAYHVGDASPLAPAHDTRLLVPPADRYWADPNVVFTAGEYHVFYEEFSYRSGKGHISTMRLGETGPLDESRVALTSDCHLSYPFVFAFEGEWFMIPESSEARRIDIFRAEKFPVRWTLAATLMDHVRAVDTTVVEHEGRWWLYTTIRRLGGSSPLSHLYLFSADSPLSKAWEPHPMNPIASGAAGARAAGGIMKRNDRLIRPAQDSRLSYGRRIELSEIVTMTHDEYLERPAGSLEPSPARGFIGLHTVSQAGNLTVVDLCRWRTRL